jgi:hypothetical protein
VKPPVNLPDEIVHDEEEKRLPEAERVHEVP